MDIMNLIKKKLEVWINFSSKFESPGLDTKSVPG